MPSYNEGDVVQFPGPVGIVRARNGTLTVILAQEYDEIGESIDDLRARTAEARENLDRRKRKGHTDRRTT